MTPNLCFRSPPNQFAQAAWVDNLPVYVHDVPAVHLPPEVVVARHIHAGRIFACKDPTDVTPPVLLLLVWSEVCLATSCLWKRKGAHGITVAYKPAIKTKRLLFLTPALSRRTGLNVCN